MVWEPVSGGFVADAHFVHVDGYYIVLRGRTGRPHLDHIGWMAASRTDVDMAHDIVRSIGWKTVIGPFEIDGSYLFHFRGPDGRVHDFFWPSEPLTRMAQEQPQ
jgi:hypothetical protein